MQQRRAGRRRIDLRREEKGAQRRSRGGEWLGFEDGEEEEGRREWEDELMLFFSFHETLIFQ